jgi:hypothetical protein
VSVDLLKRGLANIDDGFSLEVLRFDLSAIIQLINCSIGQDRIHDSPLSMVFVSSIGAEPVRLSN